MSWCRTGQRVRLIGQLLPVRAPVRWYIRTMTTSISASVTAQSGTYSEAIAALNTLQSNAAVIEAIRKSGGKLNDFAIPEMVEYLQRIGWQPDDLNRLNVIHITGTKGKGSTAAFVDSLVRHTPLAESKDEEQQRPTVGLYTSPHLVQVRERIRIDGKPIAENLFTQYFWEVWNRLQDNPTRANPEVTPIRPVYFRYLTILAFHIFLSLRVRCTILEVGIGGRYDSTNIVPRPVATGISTLGLDHTALLGNTLEEIAVQKAGIFKAGCPATSVWQSSEDARRVIEDEARKVAVSSYTPLPPLSPSSSVQHAKRGIPGAHQASNAQLAIALYRTFMQSEPARQAFAVEASTADDSLTAIESKALEAARWPGRCQVVRDSKGTKGTTWGLDGAHTVESLEACAAWFVELCSKAKSARRTLIFNTTHDRKSEELLGGMLQAIARQRQSGVVDSTAVTDLFFDQVIFCTNTTYRQGRSAGDLTDVAGRVSLDAQERILAAWKALDPQGETDSAVLPSIEEAVERVQGGSDGDVAQNVLVCGSLHLVGGVMSHLQEQGLLDDALNGVY